MSITSAAPAVQGITGGHILGSLTVSGLAFAGAIAFIAGLRGSDTIKISTKKQAMWWGIIIGNLWVAAGQMWGDIAAGIGDISKGILGGGSGLGDPGLGGIALILCLCAWAPRWKRTVWPALFGLAAGVIFGEAGGIWGIFVNVVRMIIDVIVTKVG